MKKYIKPTLKSKVIVEEQLMAALSASINGGTPTGAPVTLRDGGNGDGSDAAAKVTWF